MLAPLLALLLAQSLPLTTSATGGVSLTTQQTITGAKTFSAQITGQSDIEIPTGKFLYLDGATHSKGIDWDGSRLNLFGTTFVNNVLNVVTSAAGPTWSATAASGSDGFSCSTNGSHCLHAGTGSNDYFTSDGSGISTPGTLSFGGGTISADVALSSIAGTAGSGTGISLVASSYLRPFVHAITVARTALTAAATTQDITIWTVPAKTRILRIVENVTAAFDDAAGPISAVVTRCGPAVNSAAYLADGSAFTVQVLGDAAAEIGAGLLSATVADIPSMSSTTAISCRWTATGGNLSTLTTGSSTFYIEGVVYP